MRVLWIMTVAALAAIASACLWDRDTLGVEVKNFPGLSEVITGRFDRNPALYYEMRLERVTKEIESSPEKLDLYDDAGVACDRLGRSDKAIEWMKRKREVLGKNPGKDHLYRYHANLGTFLAHKWFRSKNVKDVSLLEGGRKHIATAIEINPDAHFGRERVQLAVMDWARLHITDPDTSAYDRPDDLGGYLRSDSGLAREQTVKDLVKGLSGLVVLGNAWESVDVFRAMGELLYHTDASVASLALARADELKKAGRKSLNPHPSDYPKVGAALTDGGREVNEWFPMLRKEADEWAKRREDYMLMRLKAGKHPDTDPNFWSEWTDPGPPAVPAPLINWRRLLSAENFMYVGLGAIVLAGTLLIVRRMRKRAVA